MPRPKSSIRRRRGVVFAALVLLTAAPVAQAADGNWKFAVTPYLWLPTIDGQVKAGPPPDEGGGPKLSVGPTDWFDLLNYGVLVSGSATRGRIGFFTDVVYLNMGGDNDGRIVSVEQTVSGPGGAVEIPVSADLNVDTGFGLDGLQWMLAAGYQFAGGDSGEHYVMAGFRLMSVDIAADWRLESAITGPGGEPILSAQGSAEQSVDLWDGIVGVRGRFGGAGRGGWSIPYSVDVGAGDSDLVWNVTVSLAYGFGWGDVVLGYRHLEYDEGDDGTLQGFSFSGPGVGASFRF